MNQRNMATIPCCPASFRPFICPPRFLHFQSFRERRKFPKFCMSTESAVLVGPETRMESQSSPLQLTYLEGNSWLWKIKNVNILVDPVLVGNLDFGVPWLYDGAKKYLKQFQLQDLPPIEVLLITQSLDDHCHKRTLVPLAEIFPNVKVIATPNAEPILKNIFQPVQVTYLEPTESTVLFEDSSEIKVCASAGPVLGPPWQRPENGYFVEVEDPNISLYYEPHCVYDRPSLRNKKADVLVTPVIKQRLPGFTLVSGQEDAVELAKLLQPRHIIAMNNGDLDSKGFLSKLLYDVGTTESFKNLLANVLQDTTIVEAVPGVTIDVPI